MTQRLSDARDLVESVRDPEMPVVTLADLGVVRGVQLSATGRVVVTITPTYTGCPAIATIRGDIAKTLQRHGFPDVAVNLSFSPAWSSDWITAEGRRKLIQNGYSAPCQEPQRHVGPLPLTLTGSDRVVTCPRCGSRCNRLLAEFGSTLCKALYQCSTCLEPFDHIKEI